MVVAISIDRGGAPIVRRYVERHGLTFPHLLDRESRIARGYFNFLGTPSNYLMDRRGNVVGGAVGYRDWKSPLAHELIERLLEEEAASPSKAMGS